MTERSPAQQSSVSAVEGKSGNDGGRSAQDAATRITDGTLIRYCGGCAKGRGAEIHRQQNCRNEPENLSRIQVNIARKTSGPTGRG